MIRRFLLVVPFLLLAGCSGGDSAENAGASPELDVYEAVVLYLLPRAEAAAEGKPAVVHVSLPPEVDAEKFCRRFQGRPVPVLPRSADSDGDPGRAAYVIRISGSESGTAGQVRVFVLDHPASQPPRCGTPYPLPLRRQADRWVIAER
jgi:hypothetical protein